MPIHLTTHSYYSLLEGIPAPSELVQAASQFGMPGIGLTDRWLLSGAVELYTSCRKEGIKPIIGLEIDLKPPSMTSVLAEPIQLLAMDYSGWQNLCRISSYAAFREDPESPLALSEIIQFSDHLLLLTGEFEDPSTKCISQLRETFQDRIYLRLESIDSKSTIKNQRKKELSENLRFPLAVTHPIFYLRPEQAAIHKTLHAVKHLQLIKNLKSPAAFSGKFFLDTGDLEARFREYPQAISNCTEILDRCNLDLPVGEAHYPSFTITPGKTTLEVLKQRAEDGARRIYRKITPEIQGRLDHELEVIANQGFEPVFLIVEEILNFARKAGIPFSSRGSAASSLVAHCLGITSPDPLMLDLYFERFLNPARTTPPDIDTDISSRGRDQIIQHVFDTYGKDRTAMVGTINRFRERSAISDVAKAFGIHAETIKILSNSLPYAFFTRRNSEDKSGDYSPFEAIKNRFPDATLQEVIRHSETILRQPRHMSVHAGGLIITPGPLTDLIPVMPSGSKGITITQFDLESVEALGIIKIDLLGIRGLTVLGDVASSIYSWRRKDYANSMAVLDSIPQSDPETESLVVQAQTIGCFQIESPGMRATLKEIQARTPDDIMVALALYRPGPLTGGLKDAFVRRFKGEEEVAHLHPALENLLQDTYGVILYQEQVLRIANQLAGLSLAEGDLLRRAMSHFDPGKQMQILKDIFTRGALEKHQVPPDISDRIWELMAAFAGYGFPKAHAASYSQVAWKAAWCKAHFPAEFMAAVLANWGGYYSQRIYLSESRRLGLHVNSPHINHSQREFSVSYQRENPVLFMGLDQIKDLSIRTIQRITSMRPFKSIEDFLARVDPRPQEAINLVKVGACQGFGTIPTLLNRLGSTQWQEGQLPLFDLIVSQDPEWPLEARLAAQQEILGTWVDAHPLELIAQKYGTANVVTIQEAIERKGTIVNVLAMRQSSHRGRTPRGELMMILTIEDQDGTLDAHFYPDEFRKYRYMLNGYGPWIMTGKVIDQKEQEEPIFLVSKLEKA